MTTLRVPPWGAPTLLTALLLSSCSLGPRPLTCDADTTCRRAFGLGWQCGDAGYCEAPVANPRCEAAYPPDLLTRPEKYGDALIIGSLLDHLTDQPQLRSAELAVQQADENGGLDGRQLGIVHCDYQPDNAVDDLDYQDAGRAGARYLVDVLGAVALVGPATSDVSTAVYDEVSGDGVIVISPSATSPLLTTIDGETSTDDDPGLFWRTVPPDDLQGFAIASDLESRGVQELAIIHQLGAYGTALADVVEDSFGGTVHRFSFENETSLIEAIVDSAGIAGVQEVLFLSSEVSDIVAFFNGAITEDRFTDPTDPLEIFLADAGADPFLLANTDNAQVLYPLVRGTRPQVPDGPVYGVFAAAYSAAYDGEDPSQAVFTSFTYDAAWLAMYGAAWATYQEDAVDGRGIARGLRKVSDTAAGGTLPVRPSSWTVVIEAFQAGESIDLEGASGPLDFDPVTGETSIPIEVWVIGDDTFVPVAVCDEDGVCSDI